MFHNIWQEITKLRMLWLLSAFSVNTVFLLMIVQSIKKSFEWKSCVLYFVLNNLMSIHLLSVRKTQSQFCTWHSLYLKCKYFNWVITFFFIDINECLSIPCDTNAHCINNNGSYSCSCKAGFTGNGTVCVGMYAPTCLLLSLNVILFGIFYIRFINICVG